MAAKVKVPGFIQEARAVVDALSERDRDDLTEILGNWPKVSAHISRGNVPAGEVLALMYLECQRIRPREGILLRLLAKHNSLVRAEKKADLAEFVITPENRVIATKSVRL